MLRVTSSQTRKSWKCGRYIPWLFPGPPMVTFISGAAAYIRYKASCSSIYGYGTVGAFKASYLAGISPAASSYIGVSFRMRQVTFPYLPLWLVTLFRRAPLVSEPLLTGIIFVIKGAFRSAQMVLRQYSPSLLLADGKLSTVIPEVRPGSSIHKYRLSNDCR